METKQRTYKIKGDIGLISHNGRLSDPLDDFTKLIKEYSSKRKKTDQDFAEMGCVEWHGGLNWDDQRGVIVVPTTNIEAMLCESSKATRQKKAAQGALWIEHEDPEIVPQDKKLNDWIAKTRAKPNVTMPQDIMANYALRCNARVQSARIMRTRPIFRDWSIQFTVTYLPEILNEKDIDGFVSNAGLLVGLGDWRPKYGRFHVVSAK